jgi:zinc/manganese transport system ATP-binding protein
MAKSNPSVVVEARELSAGYGKIAIWQGADFAVRSGQFVAILGPNGAGKTTLFRLLLGLLMPSGGSLRLFGRRPRRGDKRIGYVPQRHQLDGDMRLEALELVKLGLNGDEWAAPLRPAKPGENARALKALADVEAEDLAHKPLGVLSGGELQRIFLAQALVGQPELLLLDEPLANLDIRRQAALVALIAKIAKSQKVAVLLIAHDINPLLAVMDSVIYMANGHVATGKPEKVITSRTLSQLYGAPIEVLKDSRGRVAVLGTEEAAHPHD